jgi:hypothetical protein
MRSISGSPTHAFPPAKRIETLTEFRRRAVATRATVSPLLPFADVDGFAQGLDEGADQAQFRAILGSERVLTASDGFNAVGKLA